jgi:hypothetical protein
MKGAGIKTGGEVLGLRIKGLWIKNSDSEKN